MSEVFRRKYSDSKELTWCLQVVKVLTSFLHPRTLGMRQPSNVIIIIITLPYTHYPYNAQEEISVVCIPSQPACYRLI